MSDTSVPSPHPKPATDLLAALREYTHARVGLGRSGHGMPTAAALEFQADHALARAAVYEPFDQVSLLTTCGEIGLDVVEVDTQATSHTDYLKNPQLGRLLNARSREVLECLRSQRDGAGEAAPDVMFIVTGGLSATGINRHAHVIVALVIPALEAAGISVGPLVVADLARVGLMNDVGAAVGATSIAILIGERPGLSAVDSVGAYFEYRPRLGLTDADRNCISNIRPDGLPLESAATELTALISVGLAQHRSGTSLKISQVGPVDPQLPSTSGSRKPPTASTGRSLNTRAGR